MKKKSEIIQSIGLEYNLWERLLSRFDEQSALMPLSPSPLSVKDLLVHMKVWQEINIARLKAGLQGELPVLPVWPAELNHESEDDLDAINAWIFGMGKHISYPEALENWKEGFQKFMTLAEAIPDIDLYSPTKFPWMHGYSLLDVVNGSLEHHREHREPLEAWLREQNPEK
jgi:hypothetical protein